jgi:hypothetical protein
MTVGDRKGRLSAAGVGLGVLLVGLGVFLLRAGLEDADRWGSVFGVFLNLAGLAVAVYSAVWARRAGMSQRPGAGGGEVASQIHGGTGAGAGAVSNRIEGGTFGGPVIQGRDMYGVVLPQPGDAGAPPGQQEQTR